MAPGDAPIGQTWRRRGPEKGKAMPRPITDHEESRRVFLVVFTQPAARLLPCSVVSPARVLLPRVQGGTEKALRSGNKRKD